MEKMSLPSVVVDEERMRPCHWFLGQYFEFPSVLRRLDDRKNIWPIETFAD